MKTIAEKNENLFSAGALDIDNMAIKKIKNKEITWWIFKDGSAIGRENNKIIHVKRKFL